MFEFGFDLFPVGDALAQQVIEGVVVGQMFDVAELMGDDVVDLPPGRMDEFEVQADSVRLA